VTVLSEVSHDVAIEPVLQRLTGENLHYSMANVKDEAYLDVRARGIWGSRYQRSFFHARVFNPFASSYCNTACCCFSVQTI